MLRRAEDTLCFSGIGRTTLGQFAHDAETLRPQIAHASDVCNVFADRYDFMVGLAATMLNGQRTVLPNSPAPEAVAGVLGGMDAPVILGGKQHHSELAYRLPALNAATGIADPAPIFAALEASEAPIHVYTSGTTKQPQRNLKNWSILSGGAALTTAILEQLDIDPATGALLGTTPHQHMYGLEATVFSALAFGYASYRHALFFPDDLDRSVRAARAQGINALVLVTSPAHLKFLEASILANSEIRGVISATAPLSLAQAERLELRGDLAVMEIYGSTETGSLAIRRTVEGPLWQPLAGFTLESSGDTCIARAPHLPDAVPLGDRVEIAPDGRFELLGRVGDMVSINGKKTTLAALNAVLIETPGLADGIVLHRRNDGEDTLAIVAVRAGDASHSETEMKSAIRRQLLRHLDPVFVSRRIAFTDELPRSGTGKIPAGKLDELFLLTRL